MKENKIMLVSVVIPFYNNQLWLNEAIDSVINQTYKSIEIIVVNDGSKENLDFIKNKYKNRINYFETINKGPGHARNFGISKSNGDFIAFLDSDDLFLPEKIERQVNFMIENNYDWTHTAYHLFDDLTKRSFKTIKICHFSGNVFNRILVSSPIATPCVMISSRFLVNHSTIRFSESMRFGQDGFFWFNISRFQELGSLNEPLTKVRIRGKNNAKFKAKIHLRVKSSLYRYIVEQKITNSNGEKVSPIIIGAYRLCYFGNLVIDTLFEKRFLKYSEFYSKIFYIVPFSILKFIKYVQK